MSQISSDRIETLSVVEQWFRDGLKAVEPPGGFLTADVDMTNAVALRGQAKAAGKPVSFVHLVVVAAASALTRNPHLHRLTAGNQCLFPGCVDICLSIAGEGAVTPVLILKDAGRRNIGSIAREVRERTNEAREQDDKRLKMLERWGWVVPGRLRTPLVRHLLNRLWYRRMASGTFQVTVVSDVDLAVPFLFNTAAALGVGRVKDRVIAVEGRPEVRPVLTLACCCDHKVWNGMDTARFLNAVKAELEQPGPLSTPE